MLYFCLIGFQPRSARGAGISTSRHKRDARRPGSISHAVKTACAVAFVLSFAGLGTGCISELPRSLGNIDSSSETRTGSKNEEPERAEADPTSPWATLREASEPYWAGDDPLENTTAGEPASLDTESEEDSENPEGQDAPAGDSLVAVDRQHGLPHDYAPDDLKFVQPLGIPTLGGGSMKLREETAEAASRMLEDARDEGISLVVCSAYRSYDAQVVSYERLTNIYGEEAEGFVAAPGHSEHQLGTVIDVSNAKMDYRLVQRFADTKASEWLRQNALDHGFVLSYPRHAEEHTGYQWEPWHYRYIGKENAARYEEGDYHSPQQFFLEKGVLPEG